MDTRVERQMSETFLVAGLLSVSGGLQDAYTYISRGKVFANAQTGNIVLFSKNLIEGDLSAATHYLIPLLFFSFGIAAAQLIHIYYKDRKLIWQQLVLAIEIILLLIVALLPLNASVNVIANGMVSFACAMQVQSFRKVNGYGFASTMCIGNMRSGVESLCTYIHFKDRKILYKTLCYFGVILMFALGAGLGAAMIHYLGKYTIMFSAGLLLISFLSMFMRRKKAEEVIS